MPSMRALFQSCAELCGWAGTSAKHLINPHKMDDSKKDEAKDLLDLAAKMSKL